MRGHHHSPETRARLSEARRRFLADPARRAQLAASIRQALADPVVRARMSAGQKRWRAARPPAWQPPAEHDAYFKKLMRCGFSRRDARRAVERLSAAASADPFCPVPAAGD
jgi:hypothetical protein